MIVLKDVETPTPKMTLLTTHDTLYCDTLLSVLLSLSLSPITTLTKLLGSSSSPYTLTLLGSMENLLASAKIKTSLVLDSAIQRSTLGPVASPGNLLEMFNLTVDL